jgi:hypothetical protein
MIGRKGSGRSAAPVSRKWGLPAIDGARVAPSTGRPVRGTRVRVVPFNARFARRRFQHPWKDTTGTRGARPAEDPGRKPGG